MATNDNTTHLTSLNGVLENGTTEPSDANNDVVGLAGSGQTFYNNTHNRVEVHTGSGSWNQTNMTTTSTTTT